MSGEKITIYDLSVVISFAALLLALSILPAFPIVGFQGAITLGALSGTIIGVFLNPFHGLLVIAIILGLTPLVNPGLLSILGFFYFLPLILSWITAYLYVRGRALVSTTIIVVFIALFALSHYYFISKYMEYIAFDLAVPIIYTLIYYNIKEKFLFAKELGAIINGIIGDHVGGSLGASLMYLYVLGGLKDLLNNPQALSFWVNIWRTVAYIYPVERTILIIVAAVIVLPTIRAWRKFYKEK